MVDWVEGPCALPWLPSDQGLPTSLGFSVGGPDQSSGRSHEIHNQKPQFITTKIQKNLLCKKMQGIQKIIREKKGKKRGKKKVSEKN
jgi:hypothetical protein